MGLISNNLPEAMFKLLFLTPHMCFVGCDKIEMKINFHFKKIYVNLIYYMKCLFNIFCVY